MLKVIKTSHGNIYPAAAGKLVEVIGDKVDFGQRIIIFLSGGSSVNLYAKLAEWIAAKNDIRGKLAFAQVDERFRPAGSKKAQSSKLKDPSYDEASAGRQNHNLKLKNNINSELIKETGLWDICQDNKIPFYLISQIGSLEEATDEYNQTLEQLFEKYDYKIAVLGIGEDGHTAGLIPGYEKDWNVDRYAAGYNLGQNNARALFCRREFRQRITVTPKLLNQLDYALVVAAGRKKRKVIKRLLNKGLKGDLDKFPATVIQNIREVELFTDINL